MRPIDKAARLAGGIYLLAVLIGPFSLIYVPNVLFVTGNPAATAGNILAHQTLFRFAIVGDLLNGLLSLAVALALYRLFKGVNQSLATLMVILGGLIPATIFFVNALNWAAASIVVNGADFLASFTQQQQYALATLFLRIHSQGNIVNGVFWGLWLFPFGVLVMRSGFLPRFLGVWLIVGGFAYLIFSFTGLLLPQYRDLVFAVSQPAFFGEIAIVLWLLIKGAAEKSRPAPT
jgi:hypothetical protein